WTIRARGGRCGRATGRANCACHGAVDYDTLAYLAHKLNTEGAKAVEHRDGARRVAQRDAQPVRWQDRSRRGDPASLAPSDVSVSYSRCTVATVDSIHLLFSACLLLVATRATPSSPAFLDTISDSTSVPSVLSVFPLSLGWTFRTRPLYSDMASPPCHLPDELTNCLDREPLAALIEGLKVFEGGVLVNKHNRRAERGRRHHAAQVKKDVVAGRGTGLAAIAVAGRRRRSDAATPCQFNIDNPFEAVDVDYLRYVQHNSIYIYTNLVRYDKIFFVFATNLRY
ncbi:hypothetical protein FA95DRAFT_1578685, partial [Auriscalpium vulgare]